MIGENTKEENGQVSQNHKDENRRSAIDNNVGNMTNTNFNNNQHNTVSNNTNVPQVPEDRSENSQNYFRVDTQPNINTPQHAVPSKNPSEFNENPQNFF